MSYSDRSESPKTEGGLPARLFYNDISPPKSEDADTTFSIQPLSISSPFGLIPFPCPPLSCTETSRRLNFRNNLKAHFKNRLSYFKNAFIKGR